MVSWAVSSRGRRARRNGWSLISLIGALSIAAMVMGVCVPFFLSSHRLVDRTTGHSRAREQARELTSCFREDVRGARSVSVTSGGTHLNLETAGSRTGVVQVRYAWTHVGLLREVMGASGQVRERMVHAEPLRQAHFRRVGATVVAVLDFSAPAGLPGKPLHVETTATPRIDP